MTKSVSGAKSWKTGVRTAGKIRKRRGVGQASGDADGEHDEARGRGDRGRTDRAGLIAGGLALLRPAARPAGSGTRRSAPSRIRPMTAAARMSRPEEERIVDVGPEQEKRDQAVERPRRPSL